MIYPLAVALYICTLNLFCHIERSTMIRSTKVLFLLVSFVLFSAHTFAGEILEFEAGITESIYEDDAGSEMGLHIKGGLTDFPVYLFAGYETPKVRMLGQPLGDSTIWTFGFGGKQKWERLTFFAEFGYAVIDVKTNHDVQEEIIYTDLVDTHHSKFRPIPVDPRDYEHSYEIDNALMGRLGISIDLFPHTKLSASARWMEADQEGAIWDPVRRAENRGYWREDTTRNFGAFEIGIFFYF